MIKLYYKGTEIKNDVDSYILNVYPLDNTSPFGFVMDNVYFKTAEHAIEYLKFKDSHFDIAKMILDANNPYIVKQLAKEYDEYKMKDFINVQEEYLKKIFMLKLEQNEMVKETLLNTRDYDIYLYTNDEDTSLGYDQNNNGKNIFGFTWMKIRDEYNKNKNKEKVKIYK